MVSKGFAGVWGTKVVSNDTLEELQGLAGDAQYHPTRGFKYNVVSVNLDTGSFGYGRDARAIYTSRG
jgi:hypothetical protein